LILFLISCGKEITESIASSLNTSATAPWRETRGKIEASASVEEKDAFCVKEFGPMYVAGSFQEMCIYAFRVNSNNVYCLDWGTRGDIPRHPEDERGGIVVADQDKVIGASEGHTYDHGSQEQEPWPAPSAAKLFCLHK